MVLDVFVTLSSLAFSNDQEIEISLFESLWSENLQIFILYKLALFYK